MSRELTNLLPPEKRRAFTREYFMRLATVTLSLFGVAILMGAAMLVPPYLAFSQELRVKEADLARLNALLDNAQEKEVGERLTRLSDDVEHLSRLKTQSSGTSAVRAVLAVPHEDIRITHIAFTPSPDGTHTMNISGTAGTRSALQNYDQALAALPFIEATNLPISTYAKEIDLEFIITLTGPFTP
ncbi:MAG TPA: hypothetical protein VEA92_00330 [Candidatus Paceibacterota bacterium]|nr:hypothetical protein [Candidatus Paceibacterota bacterium]